MSGFAWRGNIYSHSELAKKRDGKCHPPMHQTKKGNLFSE